MTCKVTLIPKDHVHNVWGMVEPFMEEAAKYTHGRYEVGDILDAITDYDHDLWVAFDEGSAKGMVITCFKQYPRIKCLDMVFCSGIDGMYWKDPMLKMLQHWAYDNACDRIESSGRLGWSRLFKNDGYKMLWQTYELPIASTGLGD